MANGFRYSHLESSTEEIRLLALRPTDSHSDQLLDCHVHAVSLASDNVPDYLAISYTWGTGKERSDIRLDGLILSVPKTAEAALRRLSCHKVSLNEAYFWIDAICINQSDTAERSSQVALMRQVYSKAAEVLVWLGEDESGTAQLTINACQDIAKAVVAVVDDPVNSLTARYQQELGSIINEILGLPSIKSAVLAFFAAKWFERLWVIQEVALAQKVICYCGSLSISWWDLGLARRWFGNEIAKLQDANNNGLLTIMASWGLTFSQQARGPFILGVSNMFKATEPRDRIYGLLGMMPEMADKADYDLPLVEVYARAIRSRIRYDQDLSVLEYSQRMLPVSTRREPCDADMWPSWVPHFEWDRDFEREASPIDSFYDDGGASSHQRIRYVEDPSESNLLQLHGVIVGYIKDLCDGLDVDTTMSKEDMPVLWPRMWETASEAFKQRSPLCESKQQAFATTVSCVASRDHETFKEQPDYAMYCAFTRALMEPAPGEPTHYLYSTADDAPDTDPLEFINHLFACSGNRSLFRTDSNYVGMAPSTTSTGDCVCVLFGSVIPAVLRPTGSKWILVGFAYVHDIMEGQFVQDLEMKNTLQQLVRRFEIC